jgi:hypothetical protein
VATTIGANPINSLLLEWEQFRPNVKLVRLPALYSSKEKKAEPMVDGSVAQAPAVELQAGGWVGNTTVQIGSSSFAFSSAAAAA